jgi:hypothetical protein
MLYVGGCNAYRVIVWKAEGISSFQLVREDGRITLICILNKLIEKTWSGLIWL